MVFRDLHHEINDFIALLNFKVRLGFIEEARAMCQAMPPGSEAARYAGRLLLTAGRAKEAIELLAPGKPNREAAIDLIKAYIQSERFQEAEQLAASPQLTDDIQALDLRVGLASYLRLPVATYLERMEALLHHQRQALHARY